LSVEGFGASTCVQKLTFKSQAGASPKHAE
jgi:hypothetical protein